MIVGNYNVYQAALVRSSPRLRPSIDRRPGASRRGAMENASFLEELSDMIFKDESDAICRFVREHPHSAQLRGEEGDSLLHHACWAKESMRFRPFSPPADVNARGESGQTPLHYAVYEGDSSSIPIVQALLARGADPEVMDGRGFTQADLAKIQIIEGLPEVLDLLAGSSPEARNSTDAGQVRLARDRSERRFPDSPSVVGRASLDGQRPESER